MLKAYDSKIIGERLKELSKEKELTQIQLADILKVDKSSIAKYETSVSVPSVLMLITFADFFNTSVDYILGLEDLK